MKGGSHLVLDFRLLAQDCTKTNNPGEYQTFFFSTERHSGGVCLGPALPDTLLTAQMGVLVLFSALQRCICTTAGIMPWGTWSQSIPASGWVSLTLHNTFLVPAACNSAPAHCSFTPPSATVLVGRVSATRRHPDLSSSVHG